MFIDVLLLLASGLVAAGIAPTAKAYLQRNHAPRPDSFFLILGFTGSVIIGALLKSGLWATAVLHSNSVSPELEALDIHLLTNTLITAAALWLVDSDRRHPLHNLISTNLTTSLLAYSWSKLRRSRGRQHAATTISIGDPQ